MLAAALAGCATVPNRKIDPVVTPFHYKIGDYRDLRQTEDTMMPYRLSKDHLINSLVATLNRDIFNQEPATLDIGVADYYSNLEKGGGGKEGKLFIELEMRAHDAQGRLLANGKYGCTATGGEPFELGSMFNELVNSGTFTNREPLAKLWENLFAECMERLASDFGASVLTGDGVRQK